MKQIQVLCINDFHAQLRETESTPGCAKYAAAMQQQLSDSPNPILVFGGDNYKGDPISEYSDADR